MLQVQNATIDVLKDLTTEIKGLRQDNRAHNTGESSRTTQILAELVAKKF
jgi:hypothetical protein